MAPNITRAPTGVLFENDADAEPIEAPKEKPKYVRHIVWRNVMIFLSLHIASLYGAYLMLTSAKWMTVVFGE